MRRAPEAWLAAVGVLVFGSALADRQTTDLGKQLAGYHAEGSGAQPPLFAFSTYDHVVGEWGKRYSGGSFGEIYEPVGAPTVGFSADRTVAWVAVDSRELITCIDPDSYSGNGDAFPCPADRKKIVQRGGQDYAIGGTNHLTGVFVKGKTWTPFAYHVGEPISGKDQAAALAKAKLPPIKRTIGGADEVVKLFEKTIGSSKTLATTISDRADVFMYGSDSGERYLGPAVKQTLDKWNLAIKVTGLHAGVASKTVGFVAANIEATVGKGKPSPYRLLAIYEKTDIWKIVQLHFSFPMTTE